MGMIKAIKNLFWVLASQIPVLGIALAWWSGLLKNAILATIFALFYELIVFFWKKLGKPVWEKGVSIFIKIDSFSKC